MNVFYAEAPLQLLCMAQFIRNDDLILLRPTSSSTHQQLIETLNCLKLDHKRTIILPSRNRMLRLFALLISFILAVIYKKCTWHLGYYRSRVTFYLLKTNPRRNIYIYDDGGATLSIIKEIDTNVFPNLCYRTVFPVESLYSHFIERITFDKNVIKQTSAPLLSLDHLFIGTKLVEIGKLSLDEYVDILKRLKSHYNVNYYLRHRDESPKKIEVVESLGFTVISLKLPFELAVLSNQFYVNQVYGMLTTVLLTCRLGLNINSTYVAVAGKIRFQQDRAYIFEENLQNLNVECLDP